MTEKPQLERYTFPSTLAGEELRTNLAESLTANGFTVELGEEKFITTILTLTRTGKRIGEGEIAANMKALNARKEAKAKR